MLRALPMHVTVAKLGAGRGGPAGQGRREWDLGGKQARRCGQEESPERSLACPGRERSESASTPAPTAGGLSGAAQSDRGGEKGRLRKGQLCGGGGGSPGRAARTPSGLGEKEAHSDGLRAAGTSSVALEGPAGSWADFRTSFPHSSGRAGTAAAAHHPQSQVPPPWCGSCQCP